MEGQSPEGMESFSRDSILVAQQLLQNPNHVATYYSLAKAGFGEERKRHRMENIKATLEDYFVPRGYHVVVPKIGRTQSLGLGLQPLDEDYETAVVRIPQALESQLEQEILADFLPRKDTLKWLALDEGLVPHYKKTTQPKDQQNEVSVPTGLRMALPSLISIGKLPVVYPVILEREVIDGELAHEVKFTDPSNYAILQSLIYTQGYVDRIIRAQFYKGITPKSISVEVQEVNDLLGAEVLKRLDTGFALRGNYKTKIQFMENWLKRYSGFGKFGDDSLKIPSGLADVHLKRIHLEREKTQVFFMTANELWSRSGFQDPQWEYGNKTPNLLLYRHGFGIALVELTEAEYVVFSQMFGGHSNREVNYDFNKAARDPQYQNNWHRTQEILSAFMTKLKKSNYRVAAPGFAGKNKLVFPLIQTG